MKNFTGESTASIRRSTGGDCWIFKINYDPDLVAVAWAVPVLLDTLVNKAYDWNNEVRDWD